MIRVYCVGIHYCHTIEFMPDLDNGQYMSGHAILKASAEKWGLRYKLSSNPPSPVNGHINYLGYTPNAATDNDKADPGSTPRVTFALFGSKEFPFFGQPLSMTEQLNPIGQMSQVIQYGVQSLDGTSIPKVLIPGGAGQQPDAEQISRKNDGRSSFGVVGFPDNTEIRIRSLNIYCTY